LAVPFAPATALAYCQQQLPQLRLLRFWHGDGLPVHRRQRGRLICDNRLGGGELLQATTTVNPSKSHIPADNADERRQRRIVFFADLGMARFASNMAPTAIENPDDDHDGQK